MTKTRVLSNLAVATMASPVILGAVLWYLRPDGRWAWAICMLLLPAIGVTKLRLETTAEGRKRISYALIFASALISVLLAVSLAAALSLIDDRTAHAIGDRPMNVLAGLFLVYLGNQLPKLLGARSDAGCDPGTIQAIRRRTGWAHVLTGFTFTLLWLLLPVHLARPIGVAVIMAGILVPSAILRFRCAGTIRTNSPAV